MTSSNFKNDESLIFVKTKSVKKIFKRKNKKFKFEFFIWHNGDAETNVSKWSKTFKLATSNNWKARKAKKLITYYELATGCRCYCVIL